MLRPIRFAKKKSKAGIWSERYFAQVQRKCLLNVILQGLENIRALIMWFLGYVPDSIVVPL